jgi:hypothetical protein
MESPEKGVGQRLVLIAVTEPPHEPCVEREVERFVVEGREPPQREEREQHRGDECDVGNAAQRKARVVDGGAIHGGDRVPLRWAARKPV